VYSTAQIVHEGHFMRRFNLIRALFAFSLVIAGAESAHADVHFAQSTIDAGEVHSGDLLARKFTFVNEGPAAVEITGLHASCGCLKPRLDPLTYEPGAKGVLTLEINTLSQSAGDHAWLVSVAYRAGGELREQTLRLTGHVVREVQVLPAALTVLTDHPVEHTVVVTDLRAKPLKITEVRATSPHLRSVIGEVYRDDDGHWACKVKLEVAADCPEGRNEERLDLLTSDPDYPDLRIPVTVIKRAKQRLTATPNPVILEVPRGQASATRLILVREADDQPVEIDRVESDDSALICQWSKGENTPGAVRVRIDPKNVPEGGLRSAVHIHVSKPVETTLTVPVHANVP
jgi:hypothetical protein